MATPFEYYVDPVNGNDTTGLGTTGAPWLTVAKATAAGGIIRSTAIGDRVNLKNNGTHTLAASLPITVYGTPSETAPLVYQGYTDNAGDGGIATIACAGNAMFAATNPAIHLADLDISDSGANTLITLGNYSCIERCKLHNTTGNLVLAGGSGYSKILFNEFYDCGAIGYGANTLQNILVYGNLFRNGPTNNFTAAIGGAEGGVSILFNVIQLGNTSGNSSDGIRLALTGWCMHNSIWSLAGTGEGITFTSSGRETMACINNIVDGFSGTGGDGILLSNSLSLFAGNYVSNCTAEYTITDRYITRTTAIDSNTSGGAVAPFTDPANGNFTPIASVTDLNENAYPALLPGGATNYMWKGAIQPHAAGGGGRRRVRMIA